MSDEDLKKSSYEKPVNGNVTTITEDAPPEKPVQSALYDPSKESIWTRLGLNFESYKRAPGTTGGLVIHGQDVENELEKFSHDNPLLQQKMKPRHLQMIAVGGSIGTGLFINSGAALARAGPAGILISWIIIGIMLINVTQALGEMAIMFPVSGGFYTLAVRFLDPAFGFALGWNYVMQWAVVLPLEITAAGITVQYWEAAANVPIAAWMTIFWIAIILVNIFGTLGYAEEEFWSSCLKLLVVVMFIFAGIILNCGHGKPGTVYDTYIGGEYWRNPGAFANGFAGVCGTFVQAAFSFAGTELVGLAATETPNPRATMPSAVKNTFWRITVIFILSLTIIGVNIPYTDERLLGNSGAAASPFVLVFADAQVYGFDSFVNVTICISVLSIGLSCVYAGSRTLTALAETGYAPKVFTYVDKSGRPLWSVIAILIFGALSYVNVVTEGQVAFNWLVALSGLSTLITWGSICLCHIRFRAAWKYHGHSTEELPFRALGGAYGSWCGLILVILVLIAQFYVALWPPPDGMSDDPKEVAEAFFQVWIAVPIMMVFYIIGYWWKRTTPQRARDIDINTGRKSFLTVEEMRAYRAERRNAPFYIRIYRMLFSN